MKRASLIATGIIVLVIGGLAFREYLAWADCLETNSLTFCMRVLG